MLGKESTVVKQTERGKVGKKKKYPVIIKSGYLVDPQQRQTPSSLLQMPSNRIAAQKLIFNFVEASAQRARGRGGRKENSEATHLNNLILKF